MRNVKLIFFILFFQIIFLSKSFAEPFTIQENITKSLKIGDITLEVLPIEKDSLFQSPSRGVFLSVTEIVKLKAITQNINETCYSWIDEERTNCNKRIDEINEQNNKLIELKDKNFFELTNAFNSYKISKEKEIEKLKKYEFIKTIISSSIFFIVGVSSTVIIVSIIK